MKSISKLLFIAGWAVTIILADKAVAQDYNKEIYAARRQKLMEKITSGIIIVKNSDPQLKSNDEDYSPYRVNSDFYYLTGYEDPEAALILLPEAKKKFILFVKPRNAMSSQWYGDVPGIEGAMKTYGADTAFAYNDFGFKLWGYLRSEKIIYYDFFNKQINDIVYPTFTGAKRGGETQLINISPIVHEMRLIKSDEEIRLIRKAVDIACEAHSEAIKAIKPGVYEYEIGAIVSYIFEKNGSSGKAFAPIVAAGKNATIFHYSTLRGQAKSGELMMMDLGTEYSNYSSDVTRVLPVNGKFSTEQKEIYEIVLAMQESLFASMKTGANLSECYGKAEEIAKEGLFKYGLITDKNTKWQHFLYFFPGVGHPIGLDVHDVGAPNSDRLILKPGMVYAIEPLIYIGENLVDNFRIMASRYYGIKENEVDAFLKTTKQAFEKYKGVAARVEDDVLITETGNEVLSAKLPRTIKELEKLMTEKSRFIAK